MQSWTRSRRGSLQPAHAGYWYQDIATAYELVRALVERYERVIVDRKLVADDRFDDLEVVTADGHRIRRQFKSSKDRQRRLALKDLTDAGSTLRRDRLVLTHVRAVGAPADEYRLCATWQPPDEGDELAALLEPLTTAPTISGWASRLYRLPGERLWPAGGEFVWSSVLPDIEDPDFSREQVLAFCERFVVELALPAASEELARPGPLEQALIQELAWRVGIGRYPNHDRTPTDVAALAISLANLARTLEAALTPADVERELAIRTTSAASLRRSPSTTRFSRTGPHSAAPSVTARRAAATSSWSASRAQESRGSSRASPTSWVRPGRSLPGTTAISSPATRWSNGE